MDKSMSIGGIAWRYDLGPELKGPGSSVGRDKESITLCGTRESVSRGELGHRAKVATVERGKIVHREESVIALPHANGPEQRRIQVRSVKRGPSLSLRTSAWI
jgi:hypothetical protein